MFNLREQLANTGLYNDSDAISRGELKAYERQMNDLLAWQQQMKREMALDTTELLIERWEKIYDVVPKPTDAIRDRQINLLNKRRAKGVLTAAKVVTFAMDYGLSAKVIKRVHPYRYRVQINETRQIDLAKLDTVLTNAEPGHQNHDFGILTNTDSVEFSAGPKTPIVSLSTYQACDTFSAGGEFEL